MLSSLLLSSTTLIKPDKMHEYGYEHTSPAWSLPVVFLPAFGCFSAATIDAVKKFLAPDKSCMRNDVESVQ